VHGSPKFLLSIVRAATAKVTGILIEGFVSLLEAERDDRENRVFLLPNVCAMFRVMATNRLLRLRFEAIFICCLSVAASFGATVELGRIVIPANSSTQTASAGLQKLSGRNGLLYIPTGHGEPLPLLVLLHKAGGSA